MALLTVLATPAATLRAQQARFNEREVKAVFLFNFVHFVEWPAEGSPASRTPFVIGVLGDDPFGQLLDDVVRGETVKSRALITQRFERVEDIKTCHVLFISASESQAYDRILTALRGRPTLTVGETEGFAARGGMIRFITERNRVRLRVNVSSAKKSDPELKTIPVVMMTSSREEPDLERAYACGVNAYVVKPVKFHEFVEAVKRVGFFWAVLNEPPPGSSQREM